MASAVQTLSRALIAFQRDQTKLTFAKWREKPELSEVAYPINQATVMCKDLYFYMNSCFYQFWVQHKQMGQRQLFAEFKVTKGELQLCETPLTITFPLLPLQIKDKCTIDCWKKKFFKKPWSSQ